MFRLRYKTGNRVKQWPFWAATGLFLSLTACEMVVDVEIPEHTPKLALSFTIDVQPVAPHIPYLFVGHSQGILHDPAELSGISTATIEIKDESGALVSSFTPAPPDQGSEGYYYPGAFSGEPGKVYHLYASAPGFLPVEATTRVPGLVDISNGNFTFKEETTHSINGTVSVTFQDKAGEENFYYLLVQVLNGNMEMVGSAWREFDNNDIGFGEDVRDARFFNLFSDESFAGKQITINGKINFPSLIDDNQLDSLQNYERPPYLLIDLHSFSREEYLFRKTREAHSESEGNPFAEPVRIYSNIKNGYGVFGSVTHSTFLVPLQ